MSKSQSLSHLIWIDSVFFYGYIMDCHGLSFNNTFIGENVRYHCSWAKPRDFSVVGRSINCERITNYNILQLLNPITVLSFDHWIFWRCIFSHMVKGTFTYANHLWMHCQFLLVGERFTYSSLHVSLRTQILPEHILCKFCKRFLILLHKIFHGNARGQCYICRQLFVRHVVVPGLIRQK